MISRRIAPQIGLDAMDYERFDLVFLEKSGKNSRLLWEKTWAMPVNSLSR